VVTIFYNYIQKRYSVSYIVIIFKYFDTLRSFVISIEPFKKSPFSKSELGINSFINITSYQKESDDVT
jgi:hypothetical protein